MLGLYATNETLEIETGAAVSVDYVISYADYNPTTPSFAPGGTQGNISTATTTTVVAAPGSGVARQIKCVYVTNRGTATQTVRLKKDVASTEYHLSPLVSLSPGDTLSIDAEGERRITDAVGRVKVSPTERTGYNGVTRMLCKVGTAADAVGYWYCTSKDAGNPGAFAPGTPGLAGRTVNGTTEGGVVYFQNPATGGMYLTGATLASSVAHPHLLFDVLWINSGIVVTTTTSQTINSVGFPARDANGSSDGDGLMIGLLVAVATTNAGVNNSSTISYTNQAGTAGRTATLVAQVGFQIPATAVAGTIVWFRLNAGDKGVRSVQTITLATSLGAGTVHLLVARPIIMIPTVTANLATSQLHESNPGIRLYNDTALLHCYQATATTATGLCGMVTMMER